MIKTMLFGMGAAGNKAAIFAVDSRIINKEDVVLVNSTLTDIPVKDYDGKSKELPGNVGGTGKDRSISKKQAKKAIKENIFDFERLFSLKDKENRVKQVIFVTSTDGGSGSGSTVEFVDYIIEQLKIPVMVFAFIGRAKDIRGQRNTIEFFKELNQKATVQILLNSDFANGENDLNDSRIEADANAEFCRRLGIILGNKIVTGVEQNLDERELYKIRTTPGYMIVGVSVFDQKIKNNEQVRKEIIDMMDNLKSPDPDCRDMSRIGLIYSSEREESQYMDILPVIKEKFGLIYEVFTHRQYKSDVSRYVAVIMAGLSMPSEEIAKIYSEYQNATQSINKEKDGFYDSIKNIEFDDDSIFNSGAYDDLDLD